MNRTQGISVSIGIGVLALVCTVVFVPTAQALNKAQSVDYLRTLSRNASTDIDAAFYNPAGLSFLEKDGLHLSAGNYVLFQQKTIQDQSDLLVDLGYDEPYKSVGNSILYPMLHAAYKIDDWTAYFNFLPTGGGGGGNYENGLPSFDAMILGAAVNMTSSSPSSYARDMYFKGTTYNLGTTLGLAYKINDTVSVSAGYRFTYGLRSYEGHVKSLELGIGEATLTGAELPDMLSDATISINASGISHTIIFGVHVEATDKLSIGFHGEISGPLNITNETTFTGNPNLESLFSGSTFSDGYVSNEGESPYFAIGADYQITSNLLATSSVFVGLHEHSGKKGAEKNSDHLFVSLGLEYQLTESLIVGIGTAHGTPSRKSNERGELTFGLPHNYASGGLQWKAFDQWSINTGVLLDFGLAATDNTSAAPNGGEQTRTESLQIVGLSVNYTP